MARITLLPNVPGIPFFYNVDSAVGPGCPNQRNDVLLVQFLMITINNNLSAFSPPLPPLVVSPNEILRADGIAGPITFRAIKHFQEVERARGKNIGTDGRVDRAKGKGFGSISNTQFTIIFLNTGYRQIRPGQFQNIALLSGDCPPALRDDFTISN